MNPSQKRSLPKSLRMKNRIIISSILGLLVLGMFSLNALYPTQAAFQVSSPSPDPAIMIAFQNGVSPSSSYSGMIDTYITQAVTDANFGFAPKVIISGDEPVGSDNDINGLLRWDIRSIPPGSTVQSVSITLNVLDASLSSFPIYELKRSWQESEATWNAYSIGNNWELPGASGPNDRGANILGMLAPTATGAYTLTFGSAGISLVQSWVNNPSNNLGLIIADPSITDTVELDSGQASTAINRPKLNIRYIPPPNVTFTPTFTATSTATSTATATQTQTPTLTLTPTVTTTPTFTLTPTVTGTQPTPTVTGTITPNINIVKSVSPNQARVSQYFNFTIQVGNASAYAITNAVLTDSFPSVLTLAGAQTSQGTAVIDATTRTVTVNIGTISQNATITISILAQVNSTATINSNQTNTAVMTYRVGTFYFTSTSNNIGYRVLGQSTIPDTGLYNAESGSTGLSKTIFIIGALIGLIGAAILAYSILTRSRNSDWAGWLTRTGLILVTTGLIFTLISLGFNQANNISDQIIDQPLPSQLASSAQAQNDAQFTRLFPTQTPEILPDYEVPTPFIQTTAQNGEQTLDTTPVERILIPALGVDTIVKFVPFDGLTWMIAGLKQEVAWLGDTSWPGLGKNTGLAGHVTLADGSNGPFRFLDQLRPGDIVTLYTQSNVYTYMVREQKVVEDNEISILQPSENPQITLVTCVNWDDLYKRYLNRLIVYADLQNIEPMQVITTGN